MTILLDKPILTFEEILKLFTDMDTPEKGAAFRKNFDVFLKDKSEEERKFYGSIMLSITQDNALQLLRGIKENRDIEMLDDLQMALDAIR